MQKMRLSIQDLEIESFTVTTISNSRRGTVQGAQGIIDKDPVHTYDMGCTYAYDCPITSGYPGSENPTVHPDQISCAAPCYTQPGSTCDPSYNPCYTQPGSGC
ncbi:MAG TPA: hypothetical protein VFE05_23485 [Longimicrobiaceae bacterium]|jgi:hypothetical protein|nr:hypothetical protein [Longimicrobiaceae bacterium]